MIKNSSVVIITHFLSDGAASALRDYLNSKKIETLLFIAFPFHTQKLSCSYLYKRGVMTKKIEIRRRFSFGIFDYFLDFLRTLWWTTRNKKKFDIFFGDNCLNCFAGLLLKKIGFLDKVIFYSIDFVPIRYKNILLNKLYHSVESICVKTADETWNVSPRIGFGREKFLKLSQKKYPQKVVPIGVWNRSFRKINPHKIKENQLLFMGTLYEKQGVQLVINAIPDIIKKIPNLKFIIVGDGEYKDVLKKRVMDLGIINNVEFTGWIDDRKKINELMKRSACAVAPYRPEKNELYNFSYYADPTKIKDYVSAGLPVIFTNVIYNAKELSEKKVGLLIDYSSKDMAHAVIKLFKNQKILKRYRENALRYAKQFDWNIIFSKTLQ